MSTTTLNPVSAQPRRAEILRDAMKPLFDFYTGSAWARRRHEPGIVDLTFGDPHEMPLPGVVQALQRAAVPESNDWFAYTTSTSEAQQVVARSLRERFGVAFEPEDIAMTTGGFGAISTALKAVTSPGDEVIFSLPAWPLYETMIREAGLVPVKVETDPFTFDLDLEAIAVAITPRTRIVIVNTPNNPTGKIYPASTLGRLAELLEAKSERYGEPIYILSDEPYHRIVFDDCRPVTPAAHYSRTLLAYSYGKVLLTPGQRIGYLAMPPSMPDREQLREDIMATQIASGWMFPNALLQHAIQDLEACSIDIDHLERKRDRLVDELREMGYEVHLPQGTFYLLPKVPMASESNFIDALADQGVFVIPGSMFGKPGYFRISLTANDSMIEQSLPAFKAAHEYAWANTLVNELAADGW